VNPDSVDWKKYSRGIPYKVQQGSGEKNALGVIKFNFANPYQVYLHDTDQRRLFGNSYRALSHGCVRVQQWQKLAGLVLQKDSLSRVGKDSLINFTDSISHWISINKRQVIKIKNRLPLFIRYFSVTADQNKLVFHNDIYRQDQELRALYFSKRQITPFIKSPS
jgi:murein L,D-transpeptidase YcbB/YkuD